MNTLWVAVLPLAAKGPNPADVKPGWLGFAVFLALAAALVLLMMSFRKQLRKVDFEEKEPPAAEGRPTKGQTGSASPS
jgi:hypothetical protein